MVLEDQDGIPDALNRSTGAKWINLRNVFEDSLEIREGARA
jgi:hypothetical protein